MRDGLVALAIVTSISSVPVWVTLTTRPVRSEMVLKHTPLEGLHSLTSFWYKI